ncbi:MAG: site-specific integrase [Gammaproteobacteria bacterium]|nr:site-specific integrase [Gammaproteobacteria bacterium]
MRTAITKELLGGLKPKDAPFEVRDTKINGFLVRVQPSGATSFVVQLGRGQRVTLGRYPSCTLERARKLALNALNASGEGKTVAEVKSIVRPQASEAMTLASFLKDTYATWLEENRKTGKAEAARIKAAFKTLLEKPLAEITAWGVERWRTDRLKAGRKPTSVNRDLNTLKACLHRAVEWGKLAAYPLDTVKPAETDDRGVVRYLSPEEESTLRTSLDAREAQLRASRESGNAWREARGRELLPVRNAAFVDHIKPAVLFSLNTGLRRGELFSLQWRDVDLRRRLVVVHGATAKSGKTRHVPLSDEALAVLTEWKKQAPDPNGLVFPGKTGERFHTLKTAWSSLLEDAGIAGFRWHDLRHSFASKLVMAGVDLNTVRELMGHADIKMTLRYAHLAPSHLHEAVSKLRPAVVDRKAEEKRA